MFEPAWPSTGNIKYWILGGLIATVGFRDFVSISKTNCCNFFKLIDKFRIVGLQALCT